MGFCHLNPGASSPSHAYSMVEKTKHGSRSGVIRTCRKKEAWEGSIAAPFLTYQFILSGTFNTFSLGHMYTWAATSGKSVSLEVIEVLP